MEFGIPYHGLVWIVGSIVMMFKMDINLEGGPITINGGIGHINVSIWRVSIIIEVAPML